MINEILGTPASGILLSIGSYAIGIALCKKFKITFLNPLIIAIVLTLLTIIYTPLSIENYLNGANVFTMMILPATIVLALNVYRKRKVFIENLIPILIGCLAGSAASIISVHFLCKLFLIEDVLKLSLLPKSVTTAIAMQLSEKYGGVPSITIAAVIFTGNFSAIFGPLFIKKFKLSDSVANGAAMGVSGHAVGTARSLQIGELEGAMASISLCVAGVITSVLLILY
ncbi:MAG: LrgB family protein [Termitinemataceae bacterium]|nr:MAG: LrgB family protein [Termitinemataceae bacterium]